MTGQTRRGRPSPDDAKIARLRALETGSDAQWRYAAGSLAALRTPDAVRIFLAVLTTRLSGELRDLLLAKYAYCNADGIKRDPGGLVRIQLLEALRPLVRSEDVPLLERAATTYEFLYGEATGDLRAAGLLALNEADQRLVEFYCVRLLVDEYTSIMSGEPALTAARILAAHDQMLPLYAYVTQAPRPIADVTAECLRGLALLPPSLLPGLVARFRDSDDEIVLLGLFDLLFAHETRAGYIDFIFDFLRDTTLYNLYRYLVSALIAGRDKALIDRLGGMLRAERDRQKAAILREALELR
jgi:hypothetical protein